MDFGLGALVGLVLTLMVLSYIIGDNFLFRLALHIFIGVASGYAAVVILYNVFLNQLIFPLLQDPFSNLALIVPVLLLGIWLLTKSSGRFSRLGGPVVAFLAGVGSATAVGGATVGTLFPQVSASIDQMDLAAAVQGGGNLVAWFVQAVLIVVGTIATLAYFHFGVRSNNELAAPRRYPIIEGLAQVGQIFIAITLGMLFAGVYAAAIAAFIDRISLLWNLISMMLPS